MVAGPKAQRGITYLAVLILVAIAGIVIAALGASWATAAQREKEKELLFVGNEIRRAIGLYYERSPGPVKRYPRDLEELIKDGRFATTRRYLRWVYSDPLTGNAKWGLVVAPGGGVMGVYSLSKERPIKTAGFRERDAAFEGAQSYQEWRFVYGPGGAGRRN